MTFAQVGAPMRRKSAFYVFVGLTLVGCAQQQAQQRQALSAAAIQQRKEEYAACQAKFSENRKEAIARANCLNDADKKFGPTDLINDDEK